VERTYKRQTTFRAATGIALAVLFRGCGPATTVRTSTDSSSPHPTASTSGASNVTSSPGQTTNVLGSVVRRTNTAAGYRIVLAPIKVRKDGSIVVLPGRATATYLIPKSFVPHGFMLSGLIRVTLDDHRVTRVSIMG
jgi:hypothetical protein